MVEKFEMLDEGRIEESQAFNWSSNLLGFRREILRRYPALADSRDEDSSNPWAMTPVESPYFIELNFRWSSSDEALMWVLSKAAVRGLWIYDPQGPQVHEPGPPRWRVWLHRLGLVERVERGQ